MSSTAIDVISVLLVHAASFWNWVATGSAGFPPV
jgi:hypothetical protein